MDSEEPALQPKKQLQEQGADVAATDARGQPYRTDGNNPP